MKRSVAILGPTPAFVRWAIWHACDLRPLEPYRFADQTFRSLRGVRELSIAQSQQRCTDEICFHPSAIDPAQSPGSILGFQRREITAVFGGESAVDRCCRQCPANAMAHQFESANAGCFGFLSTDGFDLQKLLSGETQPQRNESIDLVQCVQRAGQALGLGSVLERHFGAGKIIWYRLWKPKILSMAKLNLIQQVFDFVVQEMATIEIPASIILFRQAIANCVEHDLPLHVELVPAGISDGQTWTLSAACPDCRYEPDSLTKTNTCPGCQRIGGISAGQKFRVLGTRPYATLADIIGADRTTEELAKLGRRE